MKKTALDKAIEAIDGEIAVLVAARERLQKQQATQPKRKKRLALALPATARGHSETTQP